MLVKSWRFFRGRRRLGNGITFGFGLAFMNRVLGFLVWLFFASLLVSLVNLYVRFHLVDLYLGLVLVVLVVLVLVNVDTFGARIRFLFLLNNFRFLTMVDRAATLALLFILEVILFVLKKVRINRSRAVLRHQLTF